MNADDVMSARRLELEKAGRLERCQWCPGEVVPGTTCPRAVVCPRCAAPAGSPCRRPSDHRAPELHSERVALAESMDVLETCPRCGATTIGAACTCAAPVERHEVLELFTPAPAQIPGQLEL